jgi:hypothetical protein
MSCSIALMTYCSAVQALSFSSAFCVVQAWLCVSALPVNILCSYLHKVLLVEYILSNDIKVGKSSSYHIIVSASKIKIVSWQVGLRPSVASRHVTEISILSSSFTYQQIVKDYQVQASQLSQPSLSPFSKWLPE